MSPVEQQLMLIEAMMRFMIDRHSPHISFGEIAARLGKSNKATQLWIKAHKLTKVGPRSYRTSDYVTAATRPHQD